LGSEIVNAIFYVLTTGCQWRQLPKDFPSKSTVHDYMICWDRDGVLTRLHDALYSQVREVAGRNAEPTFAIVDSQSVMCGRRLYCKWILMFCLRSGASHVSGLLARRMTAGPDVVR
jgi:transposase